MIKMLTLVLKHITSRISHMQFHYKKMIDGHYSIMNKRFAKYTFYFLFFIFLVFSILVPFLPLLNH
jgi:hypothetical protein